jgi:hypothetical protein
VVVVVLIRERGVMGYRCVVIILLCYWVVVAIVVLLLNPRSSSSTSTCTTVIHHLSSSVYIYRGLASTHTKEEEKITHRKM